MSYEQNIHRPHRRLAILRHLEQCSEYSSNASILTDVLEGLRITSSRSQVTTELVWLRDQGFVSITDHDGFMVVSATQEGVEIARGVTRHPEIKRPSARG